MVKTLNDMNKTSERIFKSGNSKAISLGKQTIQLTDFEVGDKVEVQQVDGGLFITKKEESIEDEITNFFKNGGKYTEPEVDFGESVGREIWASNSLIYTIDRERRYPLDIEVKTKKGLVTGVIDTLQIRALDLNEREHNYKDELQDNLKNVVLQAIQTYLKPSS